MTGLVDAGDQAIVSDPRTAMAKFAAAIAISPDDAELWNKLGRAVLAVTPANSVEAGELQRNATGAAYNAYLLSRTTATRADVAGRHSPSGSTAATCSARRCRPMRRASRW